jgi:hypothetical protein
MENRRSNNYFLIVFLGTPLLSLGTMLGQDYLMHFHPTWLRPPQIALPVIVVLSSLASGFLFARALTHTRPALVLLTIGAAIVALVLHGVVLGLAMASLMRGITC